MKKIIVFSMLLSLGLSSCSDYLDRNPTDQLSSETYWETEEDFDRALTACYGSLQSSFFSTSLPNWDNLTDNGFGQHAEAQYGLTTEIAQGNIDPNTGGFISGVYQDAYSGIARVNELLDKLKSFEEMDSDSKTEMEAEARMLRAFFYSYLYRAYGDVPIIDEPLNLETQHQPKSSADEVYNFMMDDIDFAIANLHESTYKDAEGHWTQDAARAYKARMILYTAYDDGGNAISDKMSKAKKILGQISGYRLADDYSDNFHDLRQEDSPEIMMSVKFLAPDDDTSVDLWYGDWIVVSPLANLIDAYENKDGSVGPSTPYTEKGVLNLDKFSNNSLEGRDPRLAKTIFINKYIINGESYTPTNARPIGTGLEKFLSPNLEPPFDYSTKSQQDWVIMRYADVLLMQAEVENELSGPSGAYDYVNRVRSRVNMPDLPSDLNKDDMREKIRHERRVELAFEGTRYFDLKRWHIAQDVLNNVDDGIITYHFEEKHRKWPIPQSEIDKNEGVLEQNPDYK